MSDQVQRYLKTAELYGWVIDLIPEGVIKAVGGETVVLGKLDAILSQGKIQGRLTAYNDGKIFGGILPEQDRLIEDWQRIVDAD
jgi:hypothetical protein